MSINAISSQTQKVGTCPHGNPIGACPLCAGGGGGGGGSKLSSRDTRRHPGEMTWNECYAMGQILKQRAAAKELAQQRAELQFAIQSQNRILLNIANKISTLASSVQPFFGNVANNLPIRNMVANINKLVNTIRDLPKTFLNNINQKLVDISDKLVAIYGELKNAIQKRMEDGLKTALKKMSSFLGLLGIEEFQDDENDEQNEDEKKRIKKLIIQDKKLPNKKESE